jgi:hypothetical protein
MLMGLCRTSLIKSQQCAESRLRRLAARCEGRCLIWPDWSDRSSLDQSWASPLPARARPSTHRIQACRAAAARRQARRPSSAACRRGARPRFCRRKTPAKRRRGTARPASVLPKNGASAGDVTALWRSDAQSRRRCGLGTIAAQRLRHTRFSTCQNREIRQDQPIDHDAGADMTVIEAAIFALAIWAPGLVLTAYLVWGPRRTIG